MQYAIVAAFAAVAAALPADSNDWAEVKPTTTGWEAVTTKPATWSDVKDKKTCTTIYVTKDCGGNNADWNACKDVTKTDVLYDDKCTWAGWDQPPKETWAPVPSKDTWAPVPPKDTWAPAPAPKETWAPVKVCTYVTVYDKVYTTKECGSNNGAWDNCKDTTKTEKCTETKTDDKCTGTWGDWNTWKSAAPKETWAPAPAPAASSWSEAPAPAAASTWAPASVAKPAASSTAWSPVAKFTGAADKQSVGFGAAAIAAIAMML